MSLHGGANHTPKHCVGCDYREIGSRLSVCGYCSKTGKLRNCPVKKCPYYKPREKKEAFEE